MNTINCSPLTCFFKLFSLFLLLFFFKDVTYELGNFSTKIKSLIVHLASPSSPLKKKKKRLNHKSPTYIKNLHPLFQPSFLQTYTNPGKISQQGFGLGRKKGFQCRDKFPQKPKSSNNSLKGGGNSLPGRGGSVRETEGREGAVVSPVGGAAGSGSPLPLPWAEAPGGPRVPPGAEEVM